MVSDKKSRFHKQTPSMTKDKLKTRWKKINYMYILLKSRINSDQKVTVISTVYDVFSPFFLVLAKF